MSINDSKVFFIDWHSSPRSVSSVFLWHKHNVAVALLKIVASSLMTGHWWRAVKMSCRITCEYITWSAFFLPQPVRTADVPVSNFLVLLLPPLLNMKTFNARFKWCTFCWLQSLNPFILLNLMSQLWAKLCTGKPFFLCVKADVQL